MIDSKSRELVLKLYPKIESALNKPEKVKIYKSNIDKYMAKNISSYTSAGPSTRPTISPSDYTNFYDIFGLTEKDIKEVLKSIKGNSGTSGKYFNNPYNVAITLSIRFFSIKNNKEMINTGLTYLNTSLYQYMFYKYYPTFNPTESVMAYTVANLSQKFKIKKFGTMLATLTDITTTCYETHKKRLEEGSDLNIAKFINDVASRMNSFMRKLANEYNENYKEQKYLQSEKDDYSDENYYEADSDSFAIDRISNKVLTNLIVNGPDRKLVELAAKNSSVSVNMLQTVIMQIITERNKNDIKMVIECLLSLYLNNNPDEEATIRSVGTNKFYVYCIGVYRQSNTNDTNIKKIKEILDKWVDETNLEKKVSTVASLRNYRKAIFVFFVFTIEKLC
jgi:hypothetical protein